MPKTSPDQLVVESLIEAFRASDYPSEDIDKVFELYAAMQILKPRELSSDGLGQGIVDGSNDGGIDSFYVFLNGVLVNVDDAFLTSGDPSILNIGARPELEVFLIQSKNTAKWEEAVWEHLLSSLPNLLSVTTSDSELEELYRAEVVERTGILRRALLSLGPRFPRVTFKIVYVSQAPEGNLTDTILARAAQVESVVGSLLTSGAVVSSEHVGVSTLYQLAGADYSTSGVLTFRSLIRERDSFVGVVELSNYLAFVRNENEELREELFDSNVRDYEGDNSVNKAIAETLAKNDSTDFWWLNNGVTVLGDHVDSPQLTLTVSRPLIVNGLQTTHVLHRAARDNLFDSDRLSDGLLVRVIVTSDEDIRDQIIAGTNRQTQVPTPALYASLPLQRDIERFLFANDWYYERRKNRYRNLGKPAKRRITINLLAQAMITLMLGQPDVARARPSTLLSKKEGYDKIFPEGLNVQAYLSAIETLKAVDEFLATEVAKDVLDEYSNVRFYVLAGYVILKLKLKDVTNLHFDTNFHRVKLPLVEAIALKALRIVRDTAEEFHSTNPKLSRDTIFKSSDFREAFFDALIN